MANYGFDFNKSQFINRAPNRAPDRDPDKGIRTDKWWVMGITYAAILALGVASWWVLFLHEKRLAAPFFPIELLQMPAVRQR